MENQTREKKPQFVAGDVLKIRDEFYIVINARWHGGGWSHNDYYHNGWEVTCRLAKVYGHEIFYDPNGLILKFYQKSHTPHYYDTIDAEFVMKYETHFLNPDEIMQINRIAKILYDELEGPINNQDALRQRRLYEFCQRIAEKQYRRLFPV